MSPSIGGGGTSGTGRGTKVRAERERAPTREFAFPERLCDVVEEANSVRHLHLREWERRNDRATASPSGRARQRDGALIWANTYVLPSQGVQGAGPAPGR